MPEERIFHATQLGKGDRILLTCQDDRWSDDERVAIVDGLKRRFPGVEFTIVSGVSGIAVLPAGVIE